MKIFNTMSRSKEEFVPIKPGKVSMYVCGPTVYNLIHIGNARPMIVFDTVRRYFEYKGYKVNYVSNFTDVDDKIIKKALEEGVDSSVISERYIMECKKDMASLNVKPATMHPRATLEIDGMIEMIQKLIDTGYAYVAKDGTVYDRTRKFRDYGKLSHKDLDNMQTGLRMLAVTGEDQKEDPLDFALWKARKSDAEIAWNSPWGMGRPGWHIECSTMSLKYLGEKFDFHGGGSDLIFPHHENEIAQSQACLKDEHSFAQYWLHNGFITINDEKMSKSKGNFFTVKDILKKYPGEVVRFFILQTHYRSPLDFSEERLIEAQTSLGRLQNTREYIEELRGRDGAGESAKDLAEKAQALWQAFDEAMEDDFNTALAISQMFALSKEINIYYQAVSDGKAEFDKAGFAQAAKVYEDMAGIIGIFEQQEAAEDDGLTDKLMNIIIGLRQDARKEKNWAMADRIRDELKEAGVVLEDTKNGVRWKKA